MIKSMTAFGRAKSEAEDKNITVEMRSVNSRYFDCTVKSPRSYLFLEEKIRNYIQKNALTRGKIDVFLTVENHSSEVSAVKVDMPYAEKYIGALRQLRDAFSLADDISVMAVARNQEVFTSEIPEADLSCEWERVKSVLDRAIEGYSHMRCEEGGKLRDDITSKLERVRSLAEEVERISAEDGAGYRAKLEDRLRKILLDNSVAIDENRLLTECAIWADKIAIDEELVRLRAHFGAFYEIIGLDEPSGKRLDFLMQEMNRETNTIGSKCNNAKIARIVVEMKNELEKIREQVQNIE